MVYMTHLRSMVWVNYNELTTSSLESIVSKGNHPQMAALFRLVNYDNLPRSLPNWVMQPCWACWCAYSSTMQLANMGRVMALDSDCTIGLRFYS